MKTSPPPPLLQKELPTPLMHAVGTTAQMHLQGFLSRILKLHLRFFPAAVTQPFLQKSFLCPGYRPAAGKVDTGQYFKKGQPKVQFFKAYLKVKNPKVGSFFEGPRRFRGPQKSEKFNFSKRTNRSVDHKFIFFAIN